MPFNSIGWLHRRWNVFLALPTLIPCDYAVSDSLALPSFCSWIESYLCQWCMVSRHSKINRPFNLWILPFWLVQFPQPQQWWFLPRRRNYWYPLMKCVKHTTSNSISWVILHYTIFSPWCCRSPVHRRSLHRTLWCLCQSECPSATPFISSFLSHGHKWVTPSWVLLQIWRCHTRDFLPWSILRLAWLKILGLSRCHDAA